MPANVLRDEQGKPLMVRSAVVVVDRETGQTARYALDGLTSWQRIDLECKLWRLTYPRMHVREVWRVAHPGDEARPLLAWPYSAGGQQS